MESLICLPGYEKKLNKRTVVSHGKWRRLELNTCRHGTGLFRYIKGKADNRGADSKDNGKFAEKIILIGTWHVEICSDMHCYLAKQ